MDALHFLAIVILADAAGNSVADLEAAMILVSLRHGGERATASGKRKRLPSADAAEPFCRPQSVASDRREAKQKKKTLQEQRTALGWMVTGTPRTNPCACCNRRLDILHRNPEAPREVSDRLLPCTDRPDAERRGEKGGRGKTSGGPRAAGAVLPCARCKYLHSTCSPALPHPGPAAAPAAPASSSSSSSAPPAATTGSSFSFSSCSSSSRSSSSSSSAPSPSQTSSPTSTEGGEGKEKKAGKQKTFVHNRKWYGMTAAAPYPYPRLSGRLKFWAWTLQARSQAWEGTGTASQSQSRRARHILGFVLKRDGKPEEKLSSSGHWAFSIAWHRSPQHAGEFAVQVEVLGYQPGEINIKQERSALRSHSSSPVNVVPPNLL
ncbi:hypothetical protein MYCTH_2122687 [Thermothelomyces thermophilus ATCC 42464]|uniref:Uncharacterized protein n=1 Tax=Thermothelomyces thermophilus (strain ATCC 42464 / BCRC 31852 / DSM 1799) TaxID=573729 RepID=G2Q5T8_THET4|nr:uncharacterized protein MYCTH_2122687 [Thermothelomyces thermophilus ATCC 42464]AEO53814.1 hypothetical protein MYCTH_2122687 [Thermothelomyces thermophilus ATCC 42464]